MYPELYISSYFCPGFKIFSSNFPDFEVFEPGSWNTVPVRHPPTAHCEANKTTPCHASTLFLREKTYTSHCLKIAKKVSFKFRDWREHLHGQKIIKNGQFLGVLKTRSFWPSPTVLPDRSLLIGKIDGKCQIEILKCANLSDFQTLCMGGLFFWDWYGGAPR